MKESEDPRVFEAREGKQIIMGPRQKELKHEDEVKKKTRPSDLGYRTIRFFSEQIELD
jgi:hypothetical protein